MEKQPIVQSALRGNRRVIPGIACGIARYASGFPFCIDIVPNVPFMAAGNPTLLSPNEAHASEVLIDVELDNLRILEVRTVEIDVVREVVQARNQSVRSIWQALRG